MRARDRAAAATLVQLRTERLARYRADRLLGAVRWVCICDGGSCAECTALHDTVIALDDPAWPKLLQLHDGCRCRFTWAIDQAPGSASPPP